MALLIERGADGTDASVHHVAGRDDVGASVGVHDRDAREDLQRRVVVDVHDPVPAGDQDAAMAVVRVLIDADVGHDHELRRGLLHRADGPRDGAVRIGAGLAAGVFRLGQTEEDHSAEAARPRFPRHAGGVGDGELRDAGHGRDRARLVDARVEKERQDEVLRPDARLADEGPEPRRATETPGPLDEVAARAQDRDGHRGGDRDHRAAWGRCAGRAVGHRLLA